MNKGWASFIVPLTFTLYHSTGDQEEKNHFVKRFVGFQKNMLPILFAT